jgi:hypothetical protein
MLDTEIDSCFLLFLAIALFHRSIVKGEIDGSFF